MVVMVVFQLLVETHPVNRRKYQPVGFIRNRNSPFSDGKVFEEDSPIDNWMEGALLACKSD